MFDSHVCFMIITFDPHLLSRENLSKDLYLMSQMDSDQFVPIWTIASMESIKALTTDMELILDILRCKEFNFCFICNFCYFCGTMYPGPKSVCVFLPTPMVNVGRHKQLCDQSRNKWTCD